LLPDSVGKLLAPLLLVGGLLLGGPFLVLGFANKADGLAGGARSMFVVSLVGALLVAAAVVTTAVLTALNRAAVLGGAAGAEPDAWGTGTSLEWATASPPAPGNFASVPTVTSPQPLLDTNDGGAS
jgi:heme/copper-type cytochrome/quinol oxidase subunit 1